MNRSRWSFGVLVGVMLATGSACGSATKEDVVAEPNAAPSSTTEPARAPESSSPPADTFTLKVPDGFRALDAQPITVNALRSSSQVLVDEVGGPQSETSVPTSGEMIVQAFLNDSGGNLHIQMEAAPTDTKSERFAALFHGDQESVERASGTDPATATWPGGTSGVSFGYLFDGTNFITVHFDGPIETLGDVLASIRPEVTR